MRELEISEEELENPEGLMAKVVAALDEQIKQRILDCEEAYILSGLNRRLSAETESRCVIRGPRE